MTRLKQSLKKAKGFYNKNKKAVLRTTCAAIAIILAIVCIFTLILPAYNYYSAKNLIEEGKYDEAYECLVDAGDFKDAKELKKKFICVPTTVSTEYSDITGAYVTSYEYDENGNCIMQIVTSPIGEQSISEMEYDKNGNCIKRINTDPNEVSTVEYTYVYEGNLVTEMTLTKSSGDSITSKYTYDKNKNCIKTVSILPGGKENVETKEYDKSNNPTKAHIETASGYEETVTYSYDADGNCVKKESKDKEDKVKQTVTYTYSDDGNLTSEKSIGEDIAPETITYELDDLGNCKKKTVQRQFGEDTSSETYTYGDYQIFYRG